MLQQSGPTVAETLGQTQQIMFSANIGHARTLVLQKKPAQVDAYGANLHDAKTTADAPGGKLRPLPDNFLMVAQFVVTSKGEDKKWLASTVLSPMCVPTGS